MSIVACAGSPASAVPSVGSASGNAGILMVAVGEQVQAVPPNEAAADALSRAIELAQGNGNDLGYPWIDPATGDLVLSVVTRHGRDVVSAAGIAVPHATRDVSRGATELRHIQDDVTFLGSRGVLDAGLIYETLPDQRDNRTLIVISAMSASLLEYLATHYPADALAVEVDPTGAGGAPASTP
jgi:hypothetical protein